MPARSEAVDYVRRQLAAGFSLEAIRKAMGRAGWKDNDIEAAIAAATMPEPAVEEKTEEGLSELKFENDIYTAALSIGRLLPAETMEEIESSLDMLMEVAESRGFRKFSGLVETLRLTIEGKELDTARLEIARVGPKVKQVFEEELGKG